LPFNILVIQEKIYVEKVKEKERNREWQKRRREIESWLIKII